MIRHILTVSAGTLASRLLGFARDAMVAALLGAGPVADAFLVAFQLVNVARRLLTEGALNAALAPAYWRVRQRDGADAAAAFAGRVLGAVAAALFITAAIIGLLMPWLIVALAPGFAGQPILQLAVDIARLMLPYLAFAGPVAVMLGVLNAQRRFTLTALSPLLFNLALIVAMTAVLVTGQPAADAAMLIAATVGVAGLLQLLVLAPRGGRLATPLRVSFDGEIRRFFIKAIPAMIANAGPQLLIVAAAVIASASPAAVSWLYFANRLVELPLGIVGVAMGTVLTPELARARGDDVGFAYAASRGVELAVGLALPATLGLAILSEPIVRALFEHGAFTAADTRATATALEWLALALPAHVLFKALAPAFFAHHDTTTPLTATLCGLAVTIVAASALARGFGVAGAAAGLALAAWVSALLLLGRGATRYGLAVDGAARRRLPRIVVAALAMGALLWLAMSGVSSRLAQASHGGVAIWLGLLIAAAVASYAALLLLSGAIRPAEMIRGRRAPPARDLRG